jgi:phospholipase C
MDGFLQRPTAPASNPGVTLAAANTFPIGFYTNRHRDGLHKKLPDLPARPRCAARAASNRYRPNR